MGPRLHGDDEGVMASSFSKIVLASNNAGKLKELQSMLAPLGIELLSQKDFALPSIEETGLSFVENAILKARYVACHSAEPPGPEIFTSYGAMPRLPINPVSNSL